MAYETITIKDAVENISSNKYLLPAIQRELVWKCEQIEALFDSILSGYPFGAMLFWDYKKDQNNKDYRFYKFLKHYDEFRPESNHNSYHNIRGGGNEVIGVLDGQQRLTALFFGLKGYMNFRQPHKSQHDSKNFEKKYLFINLLYSKDGDDEYEDIEPEYQIKFKTKKQAKDDNKGQNNKGQNNYWYEIGKALEWESEQGMFTDEEKVLAGKKFSEEEEKIIRKVCSAIYANIINNARISYYKEKTKKLDRVLNIFVKINSGGTVLGNTDFLMSMIISQWVDGREKINEEIDNIYRDFNFDIPKDAFLRACLFLADENLKFKADNFKQETIKNIQEEFDNITNSLRISCQTFKELGYSKDNLKSNLILLPLAYYIKTKGISKVGDADLRQIKKWIQLSILGRVFGSHTTTYLEILRKCLKGEKENFPLQDIIDVSNTANRNMDINEDWLQDIIEKAKKGSQDSWAILTLLYPSNNYSDVNFEEDHIYPTSKLTKHQKAKGGDYIANIQLLRKEDNRSKSDKSLEEWVQSYCSEQKIKLADYKKDNFIPQNIDLSLDNFEEFITKRTDLIKEELLKKIKE